MKPLMKNGDLMVVWLAGLVTFLAGHGQAQVFKTLYSFTSTPGYESGTNSDGGYPFAGLSLSGNTLYGVAQYGGSVGGGTLFNLNADGSGFAVLHNFLGYHSSDALGPMGTLVLLGDTLYGTSVNGGFSFPQVFGTVFAIRTNGTGLNVLHAFANTGGSSPKAGLVVSGNTLYGATVSTIFANNVDGSGFTTLHSATTGEGTLPYRGCYESQSV